MVSFQYSYTARQGGKVTLHGDSYIWSSESTFNDAFHLYQQTQAAHQHSSVNVMYVSAYACYLARDLQAYRLCGVVALTAIRCECTQPVRVAYVIVRQTGPD